MLHLKTQFNLCKNINCYICYIESTKTTSLEDVGTGVLEKVKNIYAVKIKPKNDMMYQDTKVVIISSIRDIC